MNRPSVHGDAGRVRGKSDPIDALAVARAALREPDLPRPQPGERVHREIKLLVDHRDDLVDERRRTQQRLRWHLFELDPTLVVPLRMLGRASHLERVGRWLARREQEVQVRIARELVNRCRSLNRTIEELDQELERRVAVVAPGLLELPGCGAVTAAKLLAEIGPISRFKTDAQLARHSGVSPPEFRGDVFDWFPTFRRGLVSQPIVSRAAVRTWLAGCLRVRCAGARC
jgi:transposase